jgi:hypothetical protein
MPLQPGSGAGASAVAGGSLGVGVWATSRMADEQDGVEVMEQARLDRAREEWTGWREEWTE